jgi:hypothetical protein
MYNIGILAYQKSLLKSVGGRRLGVNNSPGLVSCSFPDSRKRIDAESDLGGLLPRSRCRCSWKSFGRSVF